MGLVPGFRPGLLLSRMANVLTAFGVLTRGGQSFGQGGSATAEQVMNQSFLPESGCPDKGGLALHHRADVRPAVQQPVHHLRVPLGPVRARRHQRHIARAALCSNLGADIEQNPDNRRVPLDRRQTSWAKLCEAGAVSVA